MTKLKKIKPEVKARALEIIGQFEGSAFGAVNFTDGQLLSYGTLQYAVLVGSGYKFFLRVYKLNPGRFKAIMGDGFTNTLVQSKVSFQSYIVNTVHRNQAEYRNRLRVLWDTKERVQADVEFAEAYFVMAVKVCEAFNLTSERALVWAFDRCVQQGGALRPAVLAAYNKLSSEDKELEWKVMKALGTAYANSANPKWRNDVLSRTLTIALGGSQNSGLVVHGKSYNLADLSVTDTYF